MAVLIRDDQQVKALEDITSMLNDIKLINSKLNQSGNKFTINVNKKQSILIDAGFNDKIVSVLKAQRAKRIKDVNAKAQKFRIGLDDNDMFLMSEDALKKANNGGETKTPKVSENEEKIKNVGNLIDEINGEDDDLDEDTASNEPSQYTAFDY